MASGKFSRELIKKQLRDINKSPELGFSAGLIDENDIYKWSAIFQGPEDTILKGDFLKQF